MNVYNIITAKSRLLFVYKADAPAQYVDTLIRICSDADNVWLLLDIKHDEFVSCLVYQEKCFFKVQYLRKGCRIMTIKDASKKWGVSKRCVRLLCKYGYIDANKRFFKPWKVNEDNIPSEEALRRIGYEPVAHCQSIFTHIRKVFRSNRNKAILIALLLAICVFSFFMDYGKTDGYYSIYMLLTNVLFSATIVIYFLVSDTMDDSLNSMRDAFPGSENYLRCCETLYRWVSFPPKLPNKGHRKSTGIHGEKRKFPQLAVIVWVLFSALWVAMTLYTVSLINSETVVLKNGFSGIVTNGLFIISMVLQSQSYYHSILRMCFYQKFTELPNRSEIEKMQYNKEFPSQTCGFVKLLDSVRDHSTVFLVISSFYILSYIIIIHLRTPRTAINIAANPNLLILFIGVFLFAFLSSVIITIAPKLMLQRILRIWVDKSRNEFEKQINSSSTEASQKDDIYKKINQLKDETIEMKDTTIKTVITIIDILAPVITFIATIYDKI